MDQLILDAKAGSIDARHKFASMHLNLVKMVANWYRKSGVDMEDLISAGNIGLMLAIDRFDVDRGTKFTTAAVWSIRQWILKCISDNKLIHVPGEARRRYRAEGPSNASLEACGKILNSSLLCLNYDIEASESQELGEDELAQLLQAIDALSAREQFVIRRRFGMDGERVALLSDLAKELCITKEAVRQIQNRALNRLRKALCKS